MKNHQDIDRRSLQLALEIAGRIDERPELLDQARQWAQRHPSPALDDWREILRADWPSIREALLENSDRGQQRRQNSPFAGILDPKTRWRIYREAQ